MGLINTLPKKKKVNVNIMFSFFFQKYPHKNKNKGPHLRYNKMTCEKLENKIVIKISIKNISNVHVKL